MLLLTKPLLARFEPSAPPASLEVVRFAQFVGPPIGSLMADHTGPRSVFAAASAGIALIATTWHPLRRALVLRATRPVPARTG